MESILNFLQSIPDSPSGVLDFVTGLLLAHGYLVIFLGAALDNFGLPSSGDIVLFAGGFFANNGQASLPLVMLSGFAGALVSDNSVYWIGRIGGRPLITALLRGRLVDRLAVCIAPKILGSGIEAVGDLGIRDLAESIALADAAFTPRGGDMLLTGRVEYPTGRDAVSRAG
jgi:hypothetical protein